MFWKDFQKKLKFNNFVRIIGLLKSFKVYLKGNNLKLFVFSNSPTFFSYSLKFDFGH